MKNCGLGCKASKQTYNSTAQILLLIQEISETMNDNIIL